MHKFRAILLFVLVVLGFSANCVAQQCEDFSSYANPTTSVSTNSGLPSGWSCVWSGNSGYKPHVYNGEYAKNGNGILMSAGSTPGKSTSILVTPYTISSGMAVKYRALTKSSLGSSGNEYSFSMGYYYNGNYTVIANANFVKSTDYNSSTNDGMNYYNIYEDLNIPSGAKLAFKIYYSTTYSYAYTVLDDVCIIEHGHAVDPCGNGTGDDFSGWYSTNKENVDCGLPDGWSVIWSGNSGYKPHIYNGQYAKNGNGILMSAGSTPGKSTSILVTPYIISQGKAVKYRALTKIKFRFAWK